MSIVILHHDLELGEILMKKEFERRNIPIRMCDVREVSFNDLEGSDIVLNRVYASVANRDYPSIEKTLNLLKKLEESGTYCLNSYKTSLYDYDKYASYLVMKKEGVYTPETILIKGDESPKDIVDNLIESLGSPIILKRSAGGRGKDISRVHTKQEIIKDLDSKFSQALDEGYTGGFVAQEFVKSNRDYDSRIGIIDGKFEFSFSRSLIPFDSEDAWLASCSNGSIEGVYTAAPHEQELARRTTKIIGADFNQLDVIFTENGPCIVESNPTPNYEDIPEDHSRIVQFVDFSLNKYEERKNEQI